MFPLHRRTEALQILTEQSLVPALFKNVDVRIRRGSAGKVQEPDKAEGPFLETRGNPFGNLAVLQHLGYDAELVVNFHRPRLHSECPGFMRGTVVGVNQNAVHIELHQPVCEHQPGWTRPNNEDIGILLSGHSPLRTSRRSSYATPPSSISP